MKKTLFLTAILFIAIIGINAQNLDSKQMATSTFTKVEFFADSSNYIEDPAKPGNMILKITEGLKVSKDVLLSTASLKTGTEAQITKFSVSGMAGGAEFSSINDKITEEMKTFFKQMVVKKEELYFYDIYAKKKDGTITKLPAMSVKLKD